MEQNLTEPQQRLNSLNKKDQLYVLIMSRTRFRMNPHSIFA